MIGRRSLELKTAPQLQAMQRAGVVLSEALDATLAAAAPGVTTAELDAVFAGVLAEHQNGGVIDVEVRQQDLVDHFDQFFLVVLQFLTVADHGLVELLDHRLNDLLRARGLGRCRCGLLGENGRGGDGAAGEGDRKGQLTEHAKTPGVKGVGHLPDGAVGGD